MTCSTDTAAVVASPEGTGAVDAPVWAMEPVKMKADSAAMGARSSIDAMRDLRSGNRPDMQCQSLAEALVCNLDMPAARQPRHWFCVSLTRTIGEAHFFGGRCDADHTSRRQQQRTGRRDREARAAPGSRRGGGGRRIAAAGAEQSARLPQW